MCAPGVKPCTPALLTPADSTSQLWPGFNPTNGREPFSEIFSLVLSPVLPSHYPTPHQPQNPADKPEVAQSNPAWEVRVLCVPVPWECKEPGGQREDWWIGGDQVKRGDQVKQGLLRTVRLHVLRRQSVSIRVRDQHMRSYEVKARGDMHSRRERGGGGTQMPPRLPVLRRPRFPPQQRQPPPPAPSSSAPQPASCVPSLSLSAWPSFPPAPGAIHSLTSSPGDFVRYMQRPPCASCVPLQLTR